ncbi:MAG: D-tyrosyl-tRNA(Tyr) deacylase [Planctomycetes bacterium]|nr:D-tyrosyl-tRNA(Tyr) deacylase [Planctomycetota bacterium]
MRVVVQRVSRAEVRVGGECVGRIGHGLLVLAASLRSETEADVDAIAQKIAEYRVFEDEQGKMNLSARDAGAALLVVSQFTLAADGEKGRRPSFDAASPPELGRARVERLVERLRAFGLSVETGRFGAAMEVELVNNGPATFILERPRSSGPSRSPGSP